MKPIFCGNFEYDARQSDLERLFRKYGKVDRVDMKSGKFSSLPIFFKDFPSFVDYNFFFSLLLRKNSLFTFTLCYLLCFITIGIVTTITSWQKFFYSQDEETILASCACESILKRNLPFTHYLDISLSWKL